MQSPNFSSEKKYWRKGFGVVAGVDEVGRGALSGSVVAGCVVFSPKSEFNSPEGIKINDSKKLTPNKREKADKWIRENCLAWGIGEAGVAQINRLGIKKASEIAFRKAIRNCGKRIDFLLIDAFFIPYVKGLRRKNQLPIVNGDEKSVSIASASIIAKVYRDRVMTDLGKKRSYKKYKWDQNKGYGTKAHQKAIKRYGITKLHRKLFVRKLVSSQAQ